MGHIYLGLIKIERSATDARDDLAPLRCEYRDWR